MDNRNYLHLAIRPTEDGKFRWVAMKAGQVIAAGKPEFRFNRALTSLNKFISSIKTHRYKVEDRESIGILTKTEEPR